MFGFDALGNGFCIVFQQETPQRPRPTSGRGREIAFCARLIAVRGALGVQIVRIADASTWSSKDELSVDEDLTNSLTARFQELFQLIDQFFLTQSLILISNVGLQGVP